MKQLLILAILGVLSVAGITLKNGHLPLLGNNTQTASAILAVQTSTTTPKQTSTTTPTIETSKQTSTPDVNIESLITSKLDTYVKQGKFRGPKGDRGDRGERGQDGKPGQNGSSGISTSYTTPTGVTAPIQNLTVSYTPPGASNPGSVGAITYLSSREQTTDKLTVNDTANITNLNVTGQTSFSSLLPQTAGSLTSGVVTTEVVSGLSRDFYNETQKFITVGEDGFVRFVYMDDNYTNIKFVQCLDQDCTTKTTTTVASDLNNVDSPSLVMGSDGFARISYVTYDTPNELHLIQCNNATCSTKSDNIVDVGTYYELGFTLDSNDIPQIAYVDYRNNPYQINLARCTDPSCSGVATSTLATVANSGNFSIRIAPDGFARIVYIDYGASPRELHYIQCTNISCSTKINNTLDTGSGMYYVDLALDSGGLGSIVYSTTDEGYQFVQCTNASCSSNTARLLDSNKVGAQISIALDNSDLPRVSYSTTNENKYIKCNTASCSSKSTKTINSDARWYNSMILGYDGFARIIFSSDNYRTVYLARLSTEDGTSVASGSSLGGSGNSFGDIFGKRLNADELYLDGTLFDPYNITGNPTVSGTSTVSVSVVNDHLGVGTSYFTDCCDTFKAAIAVPGSGTTNPNGGLLISSNQNMDGNSALLAINNYDSQIDGAFGTTHKTNIFSSLLATKTGYDAAQPANIAAHVDVAAANLDLVNIYMQMKQQGINSSSGTLVNSRSHFYPYETTATHVPNMIAYESGGQFTNAASVGTMTDFKASNFLDNVTGSMTTRYGLLLDFNNTGITNAYGVYQSSDTVKNYFGGKVGLATTSPWKTLSVNGGVAMSALSSDSTGYYVCLNTTTYALSTSTTACGASSIKFKENVQDISYGLSDVLKLRPVSFDYKQDYIKNGRKQVGFIAEEVAPIIPEVVAYDDKGEIQGLDYPKFTSVLTKAIQEQQIQIDDIKTKVGISTSTVIVHDVSGPLSIFTGEVIDFVVRIKEIITDKITATLGVFKRVETEEIETKQLCVDGNCVTGEEFKALLQKNNISPSTTIPAQDTNLENDNNESQILDDTASSTTTTTDKIEPEVDIKEEATTTSEVI